jgi:hypothetical protein
VVDRQAPHALAKHVAHIRASVQLVQLGVQITAALDGECGSFE